MYTLEKSVYIFTVFFRNWDIDYAAESLVLQTRTGLGMLALGRRQQGMLAPGQRQQDILALVQRPQGMLDTKLRWLELPVLPTRTLELLQHIQAPLRALLLQLALVHIQ